MSSSSKLVHSSNGNSSSEIHRAEQDLPMAFVQSLERHGDNGQAFSKIATELGWGEEETMEYAKRYLMALIEYEEEQEQRASKSTSTIDDDDDDDDDDYVTVSRSWSTEEEILFETLLVQHLPEQSWPNRDNHHMSWAAMVAAHLPLRSTQEVRDRYMSKYATCRVKETK